MELFSLGQKIIVKFTKLSQIGFPKEKLSKIGFSKECITANFSRLSCKNVKPSFGLQAGYLSPNSSISSISFEIS